jgi:hypothetical protein
MILLMSNAILTTFILIMVDNINQAGKCIDEDVCNDIAGYITMLPYETQYTNVLYEFIADYGEDVDETYIGRDNDGEKVYHIFNKYTNWHDRIRRELVTLGYFKRYDEYWAAMAAA